MINKESNIKDDKNHEDPTKDGFIDTARMDMNCHILIKDNDTNEVLINKRG
jgi:hypothetical protein